MAKFKKGDRAILQGPSRTLMTRLTIPEGSVVEVVSCENAHGLEYYVFETKEGAFGCSYGFALNHVEELKEPLT